VILLEMRLQRSRCLLLIALSTCNATSQLEITATGGSEALTPNWLWSHDQPPHAMDLRQQAAAVGLDQGKSSHDANKQQPTTGEVTAGSSVVISSWLVMTLVGSGWPEGTLGQKEFENLAESVRTALAEILVICRAAVHVTDLSFKEGDTSLMEALEARSHKVKPHSHIQNLMAKEEMRAPSAKLAQLLRRTSHISADAFRKMNFTRLKTSYEIRVFPEMRVASKEVVSRIDRLQIFSRFADLNHVIGRNLIHRANLVQPAEGVMLDDVGYAVREVKQRSDMSTGQLTDCMEEGLLQDAREVHQYVIALSCVLVLLITCAGSAIFSLKQPSIVPSRMNPLLARTR